MRNRARRKNISISKHEESLRARNNMKRRGRS
jgi:hypothetical protein